MSNTVYVLGVLLQLAASIVALLQLRYVPHKLPWLLISLSSLLIVARRLGTLDQSLQAGRPLNSAEILTMLISLLFFVGVILISRSFREIAGNLQALTHSEAALKRSSAYNRQLLEISPDPLVTIGAAGKIEDVNTATEIATGFDRQELIGQDFCDFFTDPRLASEGYRKVFDEGAVHDYPLEIKHRQGHAMPVLYNATLYRDEQGDIAGVFATARDVTRIRMAEAEMHELYSQVAASAETTQTLLREVNHRVKNNLISIIGLLLSERKVATRQECEPTLVALDRLSLRIRGLLEVHQLLSDSDWAPVRITLLAQKIITSSLASLPDSVRLQLQVDDTSTTVSPRQAGTLALILNELATNSQKHATIGSTLLAISVTLSESSCATPPNAAATPALITLRYLDNGPGFPQAVLDGEAANVGMGLLTQLVQETLRGTVALSNEPGATITLTIPQEERVRT
jgi:PAS domain S-box-containing protein